MSLSESQALVLALDTRTKSKELYSLLKLDFPRVRAALASRQNLHPTFLHALLEHPELWSIIARNPASGASTLKFLADQGGEVALLVLSNLSCPNSLLTRFVADREVKRREAVAAHPKISVTLLKGLLLDEAVSVRLECLSNPRLTYVLIRVLVQDESLEVRKAAQERFGLRYPELFPLKDSGSATVFGSHRFESEP